MTYNTYPDRMEKSNSFPLKLFFEQWLPRLIALSIFAYLIYSLIFRGDAFSALHIGALAIILVLILGPVASRLKVFNLIDFNSKLDGLRQEQQETKAHLNQLTNQISTVSTALSIRFNPVQVVSLQGLEQLISNSQQTKSQLPDEGGKYTKTEFLRRTNGFRYRALPLLMLTRSFQITINEHRLFSSDLDTIQGETIDERIKNLVHIILQNDLRTAFPIEVIDEKTAKTCKYPVITADTLDGLRQIYSLLDLSHKIETGEEELPSPRDIDNLFNKIDSTLATIGAGLEIVATESILTNYRVTSTLDSLKEKFLKEE